MSLQASRPDPEALAATRARMAAQLERERRAVEAAGAGGAVHAEPTGMVVVQVGAVGPGGCRGHKYPAWHIHASDIPAALFRRAPADRWRHAHVPCPRAVS